MFTFRPARTILVSATALALLPCAALASSAQEDGYGDPEVVQEQPTPAPKSTSAAAAAPTSSSAGSLPFTGLEAGLIGAAGLALAGTGITLRRAGRPRA